MRCLQHICFAETDKMNTQTVILTVLVCWLIMGLALLSAYSEVKRTGGTLADAMRNNESFFLFSVSLWGWWLWPSSWPD